jgi:hypothetical protein
MVNRNSMMICGQKLKVSGRLLRVARLDADKFQFLEGDPTPVLEGLQSCKTRVDIFTFIQRLPETEPKFDYPMEWDNFAALSLTTFDEWWEKQLGFKARNKAKQAEKKGVKLREVEFTEDLVKGIWQIYNESPVRQERKFPHYGKSFQEVYKDEATYLDRSIFIGAYLEEKLIGFIKIVIDETGTQAGLMNIISLIAERDKAPTNALLAHAVRACTSRSISYLTYSNFSYGKKLQDSLSDFKERNAFKPVKVPRYYVPLTSFGRLGFKLGLHHKLSERVPDSIGERLRLLRGKWLKRRFQALNEAS